MTKPFLDIRERLLARISINGDCWIWKGSSKEPGSYGQIKVGNKRRSAHRVSYAAFVGEIPEGFQVLHKCDTPSCINPRHLFLGTNQDNVDDKMRKGRAYEKLNDMQVSEIRKRYAWGNGRRLAREFSVHPSTVSALVRGLTHKEMA